MLAVVREQEREIMRLAVRECRMDREFIKTFQGSESDLDGSSAARARVPAPTELQRRYCPSAAYRRRRGRNPCRLQKSKINRRMVWEKPGLVAKKKW